MRRTYTVRNRRKAIFAGIIFSTALIGLTMCGFRVYAGEDERRFAHGISYIHNPVSKKGFLIWSDNYGGKAEDGSWEHDVYYREITGSTSESDINEGKKTLIKADEAQEPVSASVAGDGKIIVTFEDGNDSRGYEVSQRYAVYDENMKAVKKYPQTIAYGGHSGHASSTRNRHVVFWCDGWIEGRGVNNLGSGDDVWVTSLSTEGDILSTKKVAVNEKTGDWWPVTAASKNRALLLWQRYIDGEDYAELCMAVYNPVKNDFTGKNGKRTRHTKPHGIKGAKVTYYNYNAVWSEELKVFVVNYTDFSGNGRLLLVDENGRIQKNTGGAFELPSFVREASPIYRVNGDEVELVYPSSKKECFLVSIKEGVKACGEEKFIVKISEERELADWSYRGTAGVCIPKGESFFAYPGKTAVKMKEVDLDCLRIRSYIK